MRDIDQRIVDMQFNNQQFEKGVKTSIDSLDNLKNSLKLEESAKGLSNLEKAGRSFSLQGMSEAIDNISSRFSTLGIIGITALQNITNSAINAGKRMISALTIDPIKTGLNEYETKMNAITTILTNTESKGTTLKDVNAALNELNTYADKTIYNFAEMTRNIGTFTAAGVDLKTSTTSIKGIANLAAGSGSTAMQASTAMYQLSQAIAAGSVKLMDWNSVVNAGMGGELFQKALEKTAKELGHGRDMSVSFRESLQTGWITTKVLTKTLEKFANDESLIKAATQVKTFTQLIDTMKESVQSGWAQSWEYIIGDREQAAAFFTMVNDAFGAIVGSTADARNELLAFWNTNGGRAAMIEAITNSFKALQAIMKPIGEAFREIFPAMTGKRLVEISERIRDLTKTFKIGDETAQKIKNTFKGLFTVLDIARKVFISIAGGVATFLQYLLPAGDGLLSFSGSIGGFIASLNESIKVSDTFSESIKKIGDVIKEKLSGVSGVFKKISPIFFKIAETIGSAFDKMRENIAASFANADYNSIFDIINSGLFATILLGLKKFIESLTNITDSAGGFLGGLTGILDGVRGSLESYQSSLKAKTLITIAIAIGILAAALVALSTIDSGKLTASLAAISVMFVELFASMTVFNSIMGAKQGAGFFAMGKMLTMMVGLSIAILILSSAMVKLGSLDFEGIAKGLVGIGALGVELALFLKTTNLSTIGVSSGLGLIALAGAILLLSVAIKRLGETNINELIKGLTALGVMLAELSLFIKFTGGSKQIIGISIGLTILGVALLTFAKAIGIMGGMSIEQIGKGLITLAGALTIITLALNFMPKNIFLMSLALLDMAGAITILAGAMIKMGGLSWSEIGRALTGLLGALGIMVLAFTLMKNELVDAAAMTIVITSIYLLAKGLQALGSMSLTQIGISLLALAGTFGIIGAAGLFLSPLIPVIMSLSGAIALFGAGCLAVGVGVLALSTGLAGLAVSGAAAGTAIAAILSGALGMIPFAFKKIGEGVIEFARVISDGIPTLVQAAAKFIMSLITTLTDYFPKIVEAGVKLFLALLKGISDNIQAIVVMGVDIIVKFINGVASMIPEVIQAAFNLMINFINGLANCIKKNTTPLINAMKNLMSSIVEAAIKVLFGSITGFVDVGKNVVVGFINGIKSMISSVVNAGVSIGRALMNSATSVLGIHSPSKVFKEYGENIVAGLTSGINKDTPKAVKASSTMAKKVVKASKDEFDKAVDWIDERKYYNQMSLKEELAAWERMQKRYKAGTEERKKADREAYRVRNELTKSGLDDSVKYLDDRKYYNQLSLKDELAAWERIQSRYESGTEERKRADREVYRLKKEITEKQKRLEDEYYEKTAEVNENLKRDIQDVNDAYENSLESRTQSLYRTYGLFDKVEGPEKITGSELLTNLQGQVNAFEEWEKNLDKLASKGISEGLMQELQDMGPASLSKIKALNQLSRSGLNEYQSLWEEKYSQARSKAVGELEWLRVESDNQIALLNTEAEAKLKELKSIYQKQISGITEATQVQLADFNSKWDAKVEELKVENNKDFVEIATNVQTAFKTPDWVGLGQNIIDGISKGVNSKAASLATAAASAAKKALVAAKQALGIKSPSKEFAKVGQYSMEGFAEGINNYAGIVKNSVTGIGKKAISALSSSVANISDFINSDMDTTPTIRPVMDLTDVMNGTGTINSLFNKRQVLGIEAQNNKATSINSAMRSNDTNSLPKMFSDLKETIKNAMTQAEWDMSGVLTVNVSNDRGEIIGIAETAIKDLLRRESR